MKTMRQDNSADQRTDELLGSLGRATGDPGLDLENILPEVPAEIKPIIGTLYYRNPARAKALISDLVRYVVREIEEPLFYPGWLMTEDKARSVFTLLDTFLEAHGYYQQLGPELKQLVQRGKDSSFSGQDELLHLKEEAGQVEETPEVQQALDAYTDNRRVGKLTCFFCDKPVDEGGTDSTTELGVFFGCRDDWRQFGNPDQYI